MRSEDSGFADERENHVMGVAARSALNLNFLTGIVLAAVLLAFGWVAFSGILFVVSAVPHLYFAGKTERQNVNVHEIAGRQSKARWLRMGIVFFPFLLVTAGIAAYSGWSGNSLIPGALSAEITPIMQSFLKGFAFGGVVGGVAGLLLIGRASRKSAQAEVDAE